MKKEENRRFVLFDTEVEYALLMTEFLRSHKELPWEIHTYTDAEHLLREEGEAIALLVVAESAYGEELLQLKPSYLVVLNETGLFKNQAYRNVDKYQPAEEVLKELLEVYMETMEGDISWFGTRYQTKFVGIYSPVRRCLQSTFAMTMSQILASEYKTLYLNFEHYTGLDELCADNDTKDLADLLYFLSTDKERFRMRLQMMVLQKGNLHYIPPMKCGQNLLSVTPAEWMSLFHKIESSGAYEYVVLDLSESMQGLFDILRICRRVYTLTKEDRQARCKLLQYEQLLGLQEYEDVLEKTSKCTLPHFHRLPEELEQYTKGDLADYVRRQIAEIG